MSEMSGGGSCGMESGGSSENTSVTEVSTGIETSSSIETSEADEVEIATTTEEGFSSSVERAEIAIVPSNTSHGLNQILETPETLENHAQISVEHYHNESIAQILDMNGKYISEADQARIENGADSIRAVEHNPNSGYSGVFDHH